MKILILEGLHGNNKGKKMQWRLKRTNLKVGDSVVLDCHDWKIIKVVEEKKPKRFVSVDYGRDEGDYTAWISGYINKDGEIVIDREGYKKVGKKKPLNYWEIAEKIRKEQKQKQALFELRNRPYFKTVVTEVKGKPSRGENLEKIKFPCWCSFEYCGKKYLGQINYCNVGLPYQLVNIGFQEEENGNTYRRGDDLEELIRSCKIEILKGEIHLWREVG